MPQEEEEERTLSISSSHCDSAGGGSAAACGGGGVSGNNSNNNKSLKKPKKVPQRGLGVAQLERIRLEEQKSASAFLSVQYSGFDPPLPNNLPSPNSAPFLVRNEGGGEIAISGSENSNLPALWNGDQHSNLEGKKQRVDHLGFAFLPRKSYVYVSDSSEISPPSLLSSQMEPPSNQILRYNNYASSLREDDDPKMIGMKRSYPFSLEKPTSENELPSCNSGYTAKLESRNKFVRDERLDGDFLTLAPPKPASPPPSSSYQGNLGSQVHQVFSFFPDKSHIDETSTNVNNGNGEKGESIDLKLKL